MFLHCSPILQYLRGLFPQYHHLAETTSHRPLGGRRRYPTGEHSPKQGTHASKPEDPSHAVLSKIGVFVVGIGLGLSINKAKYRTGRKSDLKAGFRKSRTDKWKKRTISWGATMARLCTPKIVPPATRAAGVTSSEPASYASNERRRIKGCLSSPPRRGARMGADNVRA